MNLQIAYQIHRRLGDHYLDEQQNDPPGVAASLDFGPIDDDGKPMHIARTYCNDGFELWLGYRTKWLAHYRAEDARRLAWFILWTWWVKGTWCGLKRWIW